MAIGTTISNAYNTTLTTPTSPPQPGAFETIERRIDVACDAAAALTQRLATLADRVLGSRPQAVQEGQKAGDPGSALARIDANANRLEHWLNCASEELARLERL